MSNRKELMTKIKKLGSLIADQKEKQPLFFNEASSLLSELELDNASLFEGLEEIEEMIENLLQGGNYV